MTMEIICMGEEQDFRVWSICCPSLQIHDESKGGAHERDG